MPTGAKRRGRLYVALHGQDDNIGDSVLRRAYLGALRESGNQIHVLTGANGAAYVAGLALSSSDVVYTSRREWIISAWRSAAERQTNYASNAGEIQFNRRRLKITLSDIVLVARLRAGGGKAVQAGLGIRKINGLWPAHVWLLSAMCSVKTWRDHPSRSRVKVGEVSPDWAFAEGKNEKDLAPREERKTIAVTMRADRAIPGSSWFESVRDLALVCDAELVVISQVERDRARAQQIASKLNCPVVETEWEDHSQVERRVREIYSSSVAVVSDRLHALVMGLTEGALPIAMLTAPDGKIARTFSGAGVPFVLFEENAYPKSFERSALEDHRRASIIGLESARDRLVGVSSRLIDALS